MSSTVCKHCGCKEIDSDPARGDAVCTNCGLVLEDNIIVSEVQFQENAIGGTSALGQFVSSDGPSKSLNIGSSFHHRFGRESRALTLHSGKRTITQLGHQLHLNQHCIDTSYNFFKMAVSKQFTRGRKNTHVIAACMYLTCRLQQTEHMLLDFSDLMQVNVYELGKTYLKLANELCIEIKIPLIDPCLYIMRFAHKLEFGDKTHEVSMTALRLVSRMKTDWIHWGRRPSGLCGAALLVAARLHDFNRTQKDIIRVVKVCEATLRKRLMEFEDTPTSQLTLDEFHKIDLEEEQDPPSFKQARQKAKLQQLDGLTGEILSVKAEIEKALEENKKKFKGSISNKIVKSDSETSSSEKEETDFEEETLKQIISEAQDDSLKGVEDDKISHFDEEADLDDEIWKLQQQELDSILMPPPKKDFQITAASLGLKESIAECMRVEDDKQEANKAEETGLLDLSGIDDTELDSFILNQEEVRIKTDIWTTANADYLREQKEKEEKEAKEKEEGLNKPEPKKKKKYKKRQPIQASSAGEAIEKMLQERKISSKINYDVLRDLNRPVDVNKSPSNEIVEIQDMDSAPLIVDETPRTVVIESGPIRPFKAPTIGPNLSRLRLKRPNAAEPSKSSEQTSEEIPAKQAKVNPIEMIIESGPVLESGPVEYSKDADEEETEEYFDDDDEPISAAKLLGQMADGEDYRESYEIDDMD